MTAARIRPLDVILVAGSGLRARPLRVFLSALGIAIGVAAMTAVLGISASSRADLGRTLDRLGTNLLTVAPGQKLFADERATLPTEAVTMIGHIGPVTGVAGAAQIPETGVYRNDHVPAAQTGAIAVLAADLALPETVGAHMARGAWLNPATARYPVVVLGAAAAERLAVASLDPQAKVWLGGEWFTVAGIFDHVPLAPELDSAALVGWPAAQTYLGFDGHPTTIYCRAHEDQVTAVRQVLAATANPQNPLEVAVSRPSDALAAKEATDKTFTALLLGLGAVALLVGGVGIANTMIISVLERRPEIGLRRALGATRRDVAGQFLIEAVLLALLGGLAGVILGTAVTGAYATTQGWPIAVPPQAAAAGLAATLLIGTAAGLYPALRAARLSPTDALATT